MEYNRVNLFIFRPISTNCLFTKRKIATVSVINDLVTDSRVQRTCAVLVEMGFHVTLIGRELPASLPLPQWPYTAIRMRLLFTSGPAFYLFFNLRLFFILLLRKADLYYANDLDTLLPNYLASRIKKVPLIYDSHELFCEVPELKNSKIKQGIWKWLERKIVPRLKHAITVNQSIAQIFGNEYGTPFTVVRNIPETPKDFKLRTKLELGIDPDKKMLIMQGAGINIDRGAEELVAAMEKVSGATLYIIGGGDVWERLTSLVNQKQLADRVKLIKKLPKAELLHYTCNADLGISIDKDTNLNYKFSLPNKLFDYIHAGIPVLVSKLPELESIVTSYQIGAVLPRHDANAIADTIQDLLKSDRLQVFKNNTARAALELNWNTEKRKLSDVIELAQKERV